MGRVSRTSPSVLHLLGDFFGPDQCPLHKDTCENTFPRYMNPRQSRDVLITSGNVKVVNCTPPTIPLTVQIRDGAPVGASRLFRYPLPTEHQTKRVRSLQVRHWTHFNDYREGTWGSCRAVPSTQDTCRSTLLYRTNFEGAVTEDQRLFIPSKNQRLFTTSLLFCSSSQIYLNHVLHFY